MADPTCRLARSFGVPDNVRRGGLSRKRVVLALGTFGLAGALTVAALAAPERAAAAAERYTPEDPAQVIARVPARDAGELAARRALAEARDPAAAVALATLELGRYRRFSDPRYLGRAQAILAPWWQLVDPPADVLLLRATIRQSIHEFPAARADLDRLIAQRPDDVNAHLTRAVVATITADYAAARESCAALAARPLVAATCAAPVEGLTGNAEAAHDRLAALVTTTRSDAAIEGWAWTALAELSIMRGHPERADQQLRAALALDQDDHYARGLLADVLLETGRAAQASELLAGREHVDALLVRLAISEHLLRSTDAPRLAALMREKIEAAAQRGDRIHLREEARFVLVVERDGERAAAIAKDNWAVQKELADARLLVEAAAAARDQAAAAPVVSWRKQHGVRDAWLDARLRALETP